MTTKAKEAIDNNELDSSPVLYDPHAQQTIPLLLKKAIRRAGKRVLQKIRLTHTVNPLQKERYFQLESEIDNTVRRAKLVTLGLLKPKLDLYRDIYAERTGYPEGTECPDADQICVVDALLNVKILDEREIEFDLETEEVEEVDAIGFDDATLIPFRAMFSGALIQNMSHSFRQPTKAEMDTFLAIESNEPETKAMASAATEKRTTAERLYELGLKMLVETEGYVAGAEVPAWHLAATTRTFMLRELDRMGKSLAA